jgi:hypothetical protein
VTFEIAVIFIIGCVVPIISGLWMPLWLLRFFVPFWTVGPPLALTYRYAELEGWGRTYPDTESLLFSLMIYLFILIGPWMAWSRTVFRLLRERRAGVIHEPMRILP